MKKILIVLIASLTFLTAPSFADNTNPEPQTLDAPLPFGIGIDLYGYPGRPSDFSLG